MLSSCSGRSGHLPNARRSVALPFWPGDELRLREVAPTNRALGIQVETIEFEGGGDDLIAALAQNADGVRADPAVPPITTIFVPNLQVS
jgi:hypothetical protein